MELYLRQPSWVRNTTVKLTKVNTEPHSMTFYSDFTVFRHIELLAGHVLELKHIADVKVKQISTLCIYSITEIKWSFTVITNLPFDPLRYCCQLK